MMNSLSSSSLLRQLRLMAEYNQWMNQKLYAAAAQLPVPELQADRRAFFGSVLGTLNHIMVADILWLQRFATHPSAHPALQPLRDRDRPQALDQVLYEDFTELTHEREGMDRAIATWCDEITEADLEVPLSYHSMEGVPATKIFGSLVYHFFNHQTHHRGQVTTLLSQAGVDVGATDLLILIPDQDSSLTA
jgi:uncharacterized damage-inducible protein DinB